MKTTQYLYNLEPSVLADMPYKQAIQLKKQKASELLKELHQPGFMEQDDERIKAVYKAEKFNTQLLEELK